MASRHLPLANINTSLALSLLSFLTGKVSFGRLIALPAGLFRYIKPLTPPSPSLFLRLPRRLIKATLLL